MVTELSVKGEKELEELIRALEWGNEFAIYFAVVNPPLIRKQMVGELRGSLEEKGIKVHSLELNSSYFDLLSIITEKVPSHCLRGAETEIHSVIFIFGAEEAIAADAETRRLFFDCLNWQRDRLRETIACPLVIWLPEFALRILALEAPDFWAWRSGVYYLEPKPVWILEDTEELFKGGESEYDVLIYQEKIRRLQQFKSLLDDYEKQPFGEELESELLGIRFNLLQESGKISLSLANYEEAKQYFLRGLKIAERLKDKKHYLSSFSSLIFVFGYQGDYSSMEEYKDKFLEIAQELGNKEVMACSFGAIGTITKVQGNYNKAEEFFKKELKIGKELGDKGLIADALRSLGSLAKGQENYSKAKGLLEESLKINEELGEKGGIVDNLLELSELDGSQGEIDKALHRIEEAQTISEEMKDLRMTAGVSGKRGALAVEQGDYQRARRYYEESLNMYEQLGDKCKIGLIYTILGSIARDLGNYEEAKRRYKESLKIFEEIGAKRLIALSQALLGISEKTGTLHQILEEVRQLREKIKRDKNDREN